MILKKLNQIVQEEKRLGTANLYIRSLLKEYLQYYVLYFIYTQKKYKQKLIFTGGTCLRYFYGLERLSEDLNFDYLGKNANQSLADDIKEFFTRKYLFGGLRVSLKQQEKQILARFPVLQKLGLASLSESDWLYVKIDLSPVRSSIYSLETSSKSQFDFNFIARHYDLPTLMANKIDAIFNREIFKGREGKRSIKGRDYYDLLWFLKQGISPNMKRLSDLWQEKNLTSQKLGKRLDKKIHELQSRFLTDFENDLTPFLRNTKAIGDYVINYQAEYERYKRINYK